MTELHDAEYTPGTTEQPPAALGHLRVIDLTRLRAGPYCTLLLAGFGAEVIKVEPPGGGDPLRQQGPFVHDRPGTERSIPFQWLNVGKKSVALDLRSSAGVEALKKLVETADMLVENFSPGVMAWLGLDYESLRKVNSRLVVVSISNFGSNGPYRDRRASEMVMYAMSGGMYATGDEDRAPLLSRPTITQFTAGLHAYIGGLMALFRRGADGPGEHVEVSIQESALDNIEVQLAEFLHEGKIAKRRGDEHPLVPWRSYACRDGYATIIGGPMRHWIKGAEMFEEPQLLEPRLQHARGRIENRREVEALMRPWLARHGKKEIYQMGQARGLAFGFVATLDEVVDSPQLRAREFFVSTEDHPELGRLRVCGSPFLMSGSHWRTGRAPMLGEHTEAVLGQGHLQPERSMPSADGGRPTRATGARDGPALAGIRVIDLTHEWAGPHAARLLADCGAEVIKVEYPKRLDHMRGARKEGRAYDRQVRFLQINRNKRSVTLDLRDAPDRASFADLVRIADVVISNARPGVLHRLGFGYPQLCALKPDIILMSLSACGQTGPEATYAGYGGGLEATCGVQSLTGYAPGEEPKRIREMDVTNGIMAASAIMTALVSRQRTGRGTWIDMSEVEAPIHSLIGEHILEFTSEGRITPLNGNRDAYIAPQGCYPCVGDDVWVAISVDSEAAWRAFCEASGHPGWLADTRFGTAALRMGHHDELDGLITEWTRSLTASRVAETLQNAGVSCGPVLSVADLAADPHLHERRYFQQLDGMRHPGFPFRLSRGGQSLRRCGPALGEANVYVACDLLGRPPAVVRTLREEDIRTDFDLD